MFHHVKDLQFNARVSRPDPQFANLLLEQFGGGNGELKAAMQYFVQSFAARRPYPAIYDLLMDIATEELSHLEIVGATITMLLDGINGQLKDAADGSFLTQLTKGGGVKEDIIHQSFSNPHFLNLTGGGPELTDSRGLPWSGSFVNANGDLTVDLRSNIAAESRAKIVYEYLLQFTDDPLVHESLRFLMTREIAHFQQFAAALETLQPNFPPGVMQGDPRYTHTYFDMSTDADHVRGPWNEGQGPWVEGRWEYVEDPIEHVRSTEGLTGKSASSGGSSKSRREIGQKERALAEKRSNEVKNASPHTSPLQWSDYRQP